MRKVYYLTNHILQRWLPAIWLTGAAAWLIVQIIVSRAVSTQLLDDLPLYIRYEQILRQSGADFIPAALLAVFLAILVWQTGRDIKTRTLYAYYQLPVSNIQHLICRLLAAGIALLQLAALYLFSLWSAYYLFFFPAARESGIRQPLLLTWLRSETLRLIIPAQNEALRYLLLVIWLLITASICLTFENHVRSATSVRKKQLTAAFLLTGITVLALYFLQSLLKLSDPAMPLVFSATGLLIAALFTWRAYVLLARRRIEP